MRGILLRQQINFLQLALHSGMLKLPERIRLMYSLGKVLATLPVPNIMEYLNVILSSSFEEIQNLINLEPVRFLHIDVNIVR